LVLLNCYEVTHMMTEADLKEANTARKSKSYSISIKY